MKKINYYLFLIFLVAGCTSNDQNNTTNQTGSSYKPILMNRIELEKSVGFQAPLELTHPGKIYIKDNLLLISEKYKGVHIYNNQNPANPVNLAFITIPGCVDIAMKGNIMYADNAIDMIAIDITIPQSPQVIKRLKNVFPEMNPPDLNYIPEKFQQTNRPANTVIVGWEKY